VGQVAKLRASHWRRHDQTDRVGRTKIDSLEATMTRHVTSDPALRRYRAALDAIYGNRIDRVVLFGSRARGEAHADSNCDLALFLNDQPDFWRELHRLSDLQVDFRDEVGAFFDAKTFPIDAWDDRTPLMHEIRRDGIEV
jgi:uncharacterized protein